MARIAGINVPDNKHAAISLTYIFGIGRTTAKRICEAAGVEADARIDADSPKPTSMRCAAKSRKRTVEGDLRRENSMSIKRLMDLGCYRGHAAPPRSAGARPAHAHERPHPEGSAASDQEDRRRTLQRAEWQPNRSTTKKAKRTVVDGVAHIHASFNNTIITISDRQGNVLCWATVGWLRLSRFAQEHAVRRTGCRREGVANAALEYGMKSVDVFVRGPGPGRESAVRSLNASGLRINSISDVTPIPHNGCRPPKKRRV